MTEKQKKEYFFLRNVLSEEKLPLLRMKQMKRAFQNIQAGLELGLSKEESRQMALEDFVSLPERLVLMEMCSNYQRLSSLDDYEHHRLRQEMIALGIFPKGR